MAETATGSAIRKAITGLAIGATALTMLVGFNPGHVSAQKPMSTTCTTLEAGFNAADRNMSCAPCGDAAGEPNWRKISGALQGIYLESRPQPQRISGYGDVG